MMIDNVIEAMFELGYTTYLVRGSEETVYCQFWREGGLVSVSATGETPYIAAKRAWRKAKEKAKEFKELEGA